MSSGGLSKSRIARMREVMTGYVERGEVPGLVLAVRRRGETVIESIGSADPDGTPVRSDTIFRISSMTKPITTAAAMMCVEECKLRLDEPVDRLLPELADRMVLRQLDGPLDDTVPASRPITVRDLLTFVWGFGMIIAPPGSYPIQRAMDELQLAQGAPDPVLPPAPDEWIRRLGTLPLMQQPGAGWMYHTGSDVLGVLIARATGRPFDEFLRERIFEPLRMTDTGFSVPAASLARLATGYQDNGVDIYDTVADSKWRQPPAFPSGAGGLVSTVQDYLTFGELMLRQGKYDGGRLLSRASVEMMTTDQLTPEQKQAAGPFAPYFVNHGWGFGMSVVTRRDGLAEPAGRFGWNGGLGSIWYADPREDLDMILMTGCAKFVFTPPDIYRDFWTLAYSAIDDLSPAGPQLPAAATRSVRHGPRWHADGKRLLCTVCLLGDPADPDRSGWPRRLEARGPPNKRPCWLIRLYLPHGRGVRGRCHRCDRRDRRALTHPARRALGHFLVRKVSKVTPFLPGNALPQPDNSTNRSGFTPVGTFQISQQDLRRGGRGTARPNTKGPGGLPAPARAPSCPARLRRAGVVRRARAAPGAAPARTPPPWRRWSRRRRCCA
jgi:CubicO group peptidase (beta-lactamase class C family)